MINQPPVQTQFRRDGCRNANTGSQDCTCGKATLHTCLRGNLSWGGTTQEPSDNHRGKHVCAQFLFALHMRL